MPPDAARDAAAGEAEAGGDREAVEDGNAASAFRLSVAFSSLVAIAAVIVEGSFDIFSKLRLYEGLVRASFRRRKALSPQSPSGFRARFCHHGTMFRAS